MKESEWLACEEPGPMLAALNDRSKCGPLFPGPYPSDRKLRLFACACCRQAWHLLTDERSRRAVEAAEQYADGLATADGLAADWQDARDAAVRSSGGQRVLRDCCADAAGEHLTRLPGSGNPGGIAGRIRGVFPDRAAAQAALLRDVFGNPFRPVAPEECYLDGHYCRTHGLGLAFVSPGLYRCPAGRAAFRARMATPAVQGVARRAYDERDAATLAVLADALEEAGCDDGPLLWHLRGQYETAPEGWYPPAGPHVAGCWALDLVLGKE